MVLFFAHIPFVVNRAFSATPTESCNNLGYLFKRYIDRQVS